MTPTFRARQARGRAGAGLRLSGRAAGRRGNLRTGVGGESGACGAALQLHGAAAALCRRDGVGARDAGLRRQVQTHSGKSPLTMTAGASVGLCDCRIDALVRDLSASKLSAP